MNALQKYKSLLDRRKSNNALIYIGLNIISYCVTCYEYSLFNNNYRITKVVTFVILSMMIASCSSDSTSTGMDDNGGNGNMDRNPTFSNVQTILNSNCGGSGCHIGSRTSGVRLDGYDNVTGSKGDQYGELIVKSNDAANSPIVDKISSSDPEYGARMPFGRGALSSSDIELIKQWIDNGAENN